MNRLLCASGRAANLFGLLMRQVGYNLGCVVKTYFEYKAPDPTVAYIAARIINHENIAYAAAVD